MMVKLFAMLMALLMSAGGSSGEIDPGHVDLDITDYGAQITFEDGTGYWQADAEQRNPFGRGGLSRNRRAVPFGDGGKWADEL